MKDILVDNNVAKNLCNPLSIDYKNFLTWLKSSGALVTTTKLRGEYDRGNQNLAVIIDLLNRSGRINHISTKQLNALKFPKKTRFLSNNKDHEHIKAVYLSNRKMAISLDVNFKSDVNGLPKIDGIQPKCVDCPTKINYT